MRTTYKRCDISKSRITHKLKYTSLAEFAYKMSLPHIYDENSRRMINLGKTPLDFIEKICGTRNPGTRRKIILQQLQAILNCHMAIATGYKQMNIKDDEALADDKFQFAFIESYDDQLVNHRFDVLKNWQEEIYVSTDLSNILSSQIMPLDKLVYDKITSPMELDMYQYYTYQNYNFFKKGVELVRYDWEDTQKLFGRGYAKTSQGMADFRRDFRKNLGSLQTKVHLQITAPADAKYITFAPQKPLTTISNTSAKTWNDLEYDAYKDVLATLPNHGEPLQNSLTEWQLFMKQHNLACKFDTNAIKYIKDFFIKDADNTKKTIKFVIEQATKNPSAYVKQALKCGWVVQNEKFNNKLKEWQNISNNLSERVVKKYEQIAYQARDFLMRCYTPEEFSVSVLTLIYVRYFKDNNRDSLINELEGSKYQKYFRIHYELLGFGGYIESITNTVKSK